MRLAQSIEAGIRFLQAAQTDAGFWSDWSLPLGESRMWTTAYTGYRLSGVVQAEARAERLLIRAADWLAEAELPGGGWGYNEQAGPDADSTALGILFLASQGRRVSQRAYDLLRSHQNEDGGFSTFTLNESYGAWTKSHPDVTAMAIQALLTQHARDEECIRRATDYVLAQAKPAGFWNSYWWNSPFYATEANLRWLKPAHLRRELTEMRPKNALETALLLLCFAHTSGKAPSPDVVELTTTLLDIQLPDGSWQSAPMLRLPPRDCYQPWLETESMPLFTDQNRIFTSVTVVSALGITAD